MYARGVETLSPAEIAEQIAELRRAHRALDEEIQRVPANVDDELQMKRLKKRKLHLKDCITGWKWSWCLTSRREVGACGRLGLLCGCWYRQRGG